MEGCEEANRRIYGYKIRKDHLLLRMLSYCVIYQKLLNHKHDMIQPEREGSKVIEDKAATKERTVDAQADVEAVQKNAEGNVPVGLTESNREQPAAKTAVKDLRALGLQRGYVGLTYDAQEEKEQKVKERHKKRKGTEKGTKYVRKGFHTSHLLH